jgi:site-specific recombinase XerD
MEELIPATPTEVGHVRTFDDYAAETGEFISAGLEGSANTKRAYAGDWRRFTTWCAQLDRPSLPAALETLAGFVTHLASEGKKLVTIQRHCAAIAKAHQLQDFPSPTDEKKFKVLLKGVGRKKGKRQQQAPAFTLAHFKRVVQGIDLSRPKGVRDRALLLLGLAGAFRREELVSLDVEHLRFDEDGLVVDLQRSKTNQLGEADEKAVFFSPDRRTCPVRAVKDWLQLLQESGRSSGPLFVSFYNGQRLTRQRLSPERVNLVVQQYLGGEYTAHSLRASFVTITKLAGADDAKIMNQTKHKTTAMIRRYTRLDNIRQHNAAQDLGL